MSNVSPSQQPLHVQYPSLPVPPKSGNTAPSQSGANAPSLVKIQDGRKIYTVRGVTFEVDQHYELIKAIGLGAYGLVCSALDLRYVPGSAFYDQEEDHRESHGGMIIKERGGSKKLHKYTPPSSRVGKQEAARKSNQDDPPAVLVPSLRHDPYARGKLSNNLTSPYVAIKKIPKLFNDLVDGKRVLREVKILQHLRGHENIVRLHDLLYPRQSKDTFRDLYIVTELLDTDLHLVLKSRQPLEEDHLRFIIYQLLKSLIFTHSSGIIHRDLKPGNLLLTGSCELKVCDYGLARGGFPIPMPSKDDPTAAGGTGGKAPGLACSTSEGTHSLGTTTTSGSMLVANNNHQTAFVAASPMIDQLNKKNNVGVSYEKSVETRNLANTTPGGTSMSGNHPAMDLTDYVITRYYRPPELLIMSHYGHSVDIWSVGCIFAEILLHKPVFPGKDYLSQLTMIAQTPGLLHLPKTPEQLEQCFVGGAEGKNYLKDLFFGRGRNKRGNGSGSDSPQSESPGSGTLQTPNKSSPGTGGLSLDALRTQLFGPDAHRYVSDAAMTFLAPALSFDPAKRPTALQALRHPYFSKMYAAEDEIWKDNNQTQYSKYSKELSDEEASAQKQYESEEEDQGEMWEFDQRDLQESDLRSLFWGEIERAQRRRQRFAKAGTVIAKGGEPASPTVSPGARTISPGKR
ncbi:mitogen-activated protein kinase 7, putative [Bodo saltans]|uniref:Mitogen-activated protein kinase 7, putative n=1 Tax=Bodo saltans TaxID=75058 RepID=A0A0S4KIN4_BODSA|nr:mitogen-activated protein kinase 7, putative [Bodo saltans]|eukprot:CUI15022.1 mitogen-activated protein kinase 7, putative [Bodo saltans]